MERLKSRFLEELAKGLENHQDKENILSEYETHIDEIFFEVLGEKNEATMELLISRLGEPNEIAEMWREELSFTPSRMKWLFILLNIFLFAGGSLLTLVHNLYEWKWLSIIWNNLTSIPTMIAF